jgi:hypothetical protein
MGIFCDWVAFSGIRRSWSWLAERIDETGRKLVGKRANSVIIRGRVEDVR